MKKLIPILLLFLWTTNSGIAQKAALLTSGSVQFILPTTPANQNFPGDVITIPFFASNNTGDHNIFMHCTFKLNQGGIVFFEQEIPPITLGYYPQDTNGDLQFVFPSACELTDGDYEWSLDVFYSQDTATSPINISTFDQYNSEICANMEIPVHDPKRSDTCTFDIYSIDYFNDVPDCCTTPSIEINSVKYNYVWRCGCSFLLTPTIIFPNDTPNLTYIWTNSANDIVSTCSAIHHYCGEETYTLTISWLEDGVVCTASESFTTDIECCSCEDKSDCSGEGGGGGNDDAITFSTSSPNHQVKEIGKNKMSEETIIFPNPNQGQFQLRFPNDKEVLNIQVWNLIGELLSTETGPFDLVHPIRLAKEIPGTYYLSVKYVDETSEFHKFILN